MTQKEAYRVETHRKMNDDYSVQLPLKKQLARGFAEVACDYAVSKRDYEKTMKGEGLA